MHTPCENIRPPVQRDVEVGGNRLRLFVESAPYIAALVQDIRKARQRVWIESYTIADDAAGRAVAEAVKQRVAAGVSCRILYDAIGSLATSKRFFSELQQAGVDVRAFRPWGRCRWRWLRQFHRRNHRKLVVIDDDLAYFGGMNIIAHGCPQADAWDAAHGVSSTNPWRDVQLRLAGPDAAQVAAAMESFWSRSPRRRGPSPKPRETMALLASGKDRVLCFDTGLRSRLRNPEPLFKALIDQARRRIVIAMAYFLPPAGLLRALLRARRRGAHVAVIVPRHSDVIFVQWASRHIYEALLRRGVRIYERRDVMLHSKVMVVDADWSIVGSCNLDPRSLRINAEFFAVIRSAELAARLAEVCRQERRCSDPVRLSHHRQRGPLQRMLQRFAWTFRRWL